MVARRPVRRQRDAPDKARNRRQAVHLLLNIQEEALEALRDHKMPVIAVHLMNHDVLPTYEAARGRIEVVLSTNGREFCGRPDRRKRAM